MIYKVHFTCSVIMINDASTYMQEYVCMIAGGWRVSIYYALRPLGLEGTDS